MNRPMNRTCWALLLLFPLLGTQLVTAQIYTPQQPPQQQGHNPYGQPPVPTPPVPNPPMPTPTPPATSPIAGGWQGTGTEQVEYGQSVSYPVSIVFQDNAGVLTAVAKAQVELEGDDGRPVKVEYHATFSGRATAQGIQMTSSRVEVFVPQTGERVPMDTQYLRLSVQGSRMSGSVGNEVEGWTQVQLTKVASTPTPVPTPAPTPHPYPNPHPNPNPSPNPVPSPYPHPSPNPSPNPSPTPGPHGQTTSIPVQLDPTVAGFPAAASMKAPATLRPGMRFTFWLGTADVIGAAGQSTLKPDANGAWVGTDGKRYSEDVVASGGGAAGYTVIDITAVTDQAIAMTSTSFDGDGTVAPPTPGSINTFVCHPSGCEYWINPQLLAPVKSSQHGGVNYFRGPYTQDGRTYDAVMIQVVSANASSHNVFDVKTGFSLSMGARMASRKTKQNFDPATGKVTPGQSTNSTLVVSRLRNVRQVNIPWAQYGNAPETKGRTMQFRGQQSLDMGMGYPTSTPIQMNTTVAHTDGVITMYESSISMGQGGTPFRQRLYCTGAQIGSVKMPPQALATLKTGQEIDRDPITGYRTFVEFVGKNEMGQALVVLSLAGQSGLRRWVYDAQSGQLIEALTQYTTGQPASTTKVVMQLAR